MVTNIHSEGSDKSNNIMAPPFIQAIKTWNPASNDDQTFVVDPKMSDIIIPIMGPTGFGKSRIINIIAGKPVMEVGHGLQPCTQSIQHVVLRPTDTGDDRRIILVDTPGIVEDPTDKCLKVDEAQILRRVYHWVKRSYWKGMRVAGIVYLYDIAQPRALSTFGQPFVNTNIFKRLCGENYLQRIVLAATEWDDIKLTPEIRREREEQLRDTYWDGMGPTIINIPTGSSASELVNFILGISANVSEPTPTPPKTTVPKDSFKIRRRLEVHTAREIPDKFKVVEPNVDDIVIAVIGPMGVGKSKTINTIAGRTVMEVRHGLQQQCTPSLIQYVPIPHPHDSGRRIILVDTPGFDKTYENWEILRRICDWLESSYGKEKKLSGIICLHDMSQKPLFQTSHQNLTVFKQLCGDDGFVNIILGTTKWGKLTQEAGQERERRLADGYWKEMVQRGSTMMRVQSDAWDIIDRILDNVDYNVVQVELRGVQKIVPRTEHGDILRKKLQELLNEMEGNRATIGGEEYQQKLGEIRKRMRETTVQVAKLNVPLGPRIKTFLRMDLTKQEAETAPRNGKAVDAQDERQEIRPQITDEASSRSLLQVLEKNREEVSDSVGMERKSSDDQGGTWPGARDTETPSGSPLLQRSKRGRREFTSDMAKKCDLMTVEDPKESDIIIPIMGPTGVGKSTLVNQIMGKQAVVVSHDLVSCTSSIQHVITPHPTEPDRRVILVDTPGFDDTYVDDAEILDRIALWLARSYHDDMNLAGIVYLHDICQARITGTASKNLDIFKKLCGEDALGNVVLGTTKWTTIRQEIGQQRERQLRDTFWKDMIERGSVVKRVGDDSSSAREILDHILRNKAVESVLIQDEVVEQRIPIPKTTAGRMLRYTPDQFEALSRQMEDDAGEE